MYFACERDMNFGRLEGVLLWVQLCPSKVPVLKL